MSDPFFVRNIDFEWEIVKTRFVGGIILDSGQVKIHVNQFMHSIINFVFDFVSPQKS